MKRPQFVLEATMIEERNTWELSPQPRPKADCDKDSTFRSNPSYSMGGSMSDMFLESSESDDT